MSFDTTALLSRWRLRSVLDGTETDWTDAIGLDLCDAVTSKKITPRILARNADYYVRYQDIAVTANRHKYPIPSRAYLGKIHSLYLLNSSKTQVDLLPYTDQRLIGLQNTGAPINHMITDNSIVLGTIPSTTGYLRVYYPYRPSLLVATTAVMEVTSRTAGKLNGTPPGAWSTNDTFDVISAGTPFELVNASLTASSVSGGVTFTESDLDTDRIDDGGTYYVTLENQTCFPMMPQEFHWTLAELASCPVLEAVGDEGWRDREAKTNAELEDLVNACIMRKQTEHKPVITPFSTLRYFS